MILTEVDVEVNEKKGGLFCFVVSFVFGLVWFCDEENGIFVSGFFETKQARHRIQCVSYLPSVS